MNFNTEYALQEVREVQAQYFDKKNQCYTGVNLSATMMEKMIALIDMLEVDLKIAENKNK